MKKFTLGMLFVLTTILVGCNGNVVVDGSGGNTGGGYGYSGWYNVYGSQCGSLKAGCNFWSDGLKIVDYEDPYYGGNYTWNYYYDYYYGSYVWQSPSGLIYNEWGDCLNNAKAPKLRRDLITVISDSEAKLIESAASTFGKQYSLSSDVARKVARSFNDYAKLGFLRGNKGRTAADVADFTKRLYGVDLKKVSSALMSASLGDNSELNSTINVVAGNWKTSPETMREILNSFHGKQLENAGISLE
ncbi:MAG: hypothetical protein ACOYL6_11335 [Bacteriovoracaceae bacterium]